MTREEMFALWAVANTAQELIDEIRARYPGEALQCPYVQGLDLALKDLHGVAGTRLVEVPEDFDFHYVSVGPKEYYVPVEAT